MCGIVAYTGKNDASSILLDGLKALEYRGYDSAGIYLPTKGVIKSVGKIENLAKKVGDHKGFHFESGVAHTRWATHGAPTEENAHPHSDGKGEIWLVHNGIIENYQEIKKKLLEKGSKFKSDTDSEVLAHLIGLFFEEGNSLEESVAKALRQVRGTYGIVVVSKSSPHRLVAARMGSPIVVGVGEGEYIIASDPSAIIKHMKDVIYLDDGEMVVVEPEDYRLFNLDLFEIQKETHKIEWEVEEIKKQGYPHFMLKEIMESPEVLVNSARGRIIAKTGDVKLGGLETVEKELRGIKKLVIIGCGSAYYAGVVGKYMIEELAQIPVEVLIGSELRYENYVYEKDSVLLAISQSGETADTLAPLKEAKAKGVKTLGVVNVVGSTISRETDAGVYNHAGPEIGVASTKAFISQVEVLLLIAIFLGRQRHLSATAASDILSELLLLPEKLQKFLKDTESLKAIAEKYSESESFLYIGRKYNFSMAYEGALKMKEVSYIHAEGYGAGEMKHGPIALIDEYFPTVAIANDGSMYEKMISNIEEIRARSGPVIAIATEGNDGISRLANDVIYVPRVPEIFSPIVNAAPLQLLAYYMSVLKGLDVDKPRNLAKSVTVE